MTYRIVAEDHADVLFRIASVVNLANQAPRSFVLSAKEPPEVLLKIVMRDISEGLADMIHRKLMQLTCVIGVEARVSME